MKPNEINIEKFLARNLPGCINFNNDIVLVTDIAAVNLLTHPTRLAATTALLCVEGEIECSVNLKRFTIRPNGLLVNFSGDIIQIHRADNVKGYAAIISQNYTHELQLDFRLSSESFINVRGSGAVSIGASDIETFRHYVALLKKFIARGNALVLRALSQALAYTVLDLVNSYRSEHAESTGEQSRSQLLFEKFMRLLAAHHDRERNLSFYAGKMFLSPKYVSGMVKAYSGKSACEWINEYVILEAKIMLRYSDRSIQQIAYQLNFPTQSAFGKYFKEQVGCSPRAYRSSF